MRIFLLLLLSYITQNHADTRVSENNLRRRTKTLCDIETKIECEVVGGGSCQDLEALPQKFALSFTYVVNNIGPVDLRVDIASLADRRELDGVTTKVDGLVPIGTIIAPGQSVASKPNVVEFDKANSGTVHYSFLTQGQGSDDTEACLDTGIFDVVVPEVSKIPDAPEYIVISSSTYEVVAP